MAMTSAEFCARFPQLQQVYQDIKTQEDIIERQNATIQQLTAEINKVGYKVVDQGNGVYTVEKDEAAELPSGDYLNPITYNVGDTVEEGKFYHEVGEGKDAELIWEAIKSGTPADFTDTEYFDIRG